MDISTFNHNLFSFINRASTPYHAVSALEHELTGQQFVKLDEGKSWRIEQGKKYFCSRNGSLIAFTTGLQTDLSQGFRIIGTHTDSPALQIKPRKKSGAAPYLIGGVETYGGALLSTWFDRELSLAGRILYSTGTNQHKIGLIDFKRPLLYIPSLAIHLNRTANDGHEINPQLHVSPIIAQSIEEQIPEIESILLDQTKKEYPDANVCRIHGFDLFCYDPSEPTYFGLNNEFISTSRLDNLVSCFIGLTSLAHIDETTNSFLICSNHEEIGSRSNSGALGNFAFSVLSRILESNQERSICLHNSFLLSLDNAHASHPNYQDSFDKDHKIFLNRGPVIKINASQRYTTSGVTAAVMKLLAEEIDIQCQDFIMRSDMPCGSTIGPLTASHLGVSAVDMGIPTWGMHSIREVTGSRDPFELYKLTKHFLNKKTLPPCNK